MMGMANAGHVGFGGYGAGSDGSKFLDGLTASGWPKTFNHRLILLNARRAYHETPQAKAMVDRWADTVVAAGLKVEMSPVVDILGISMEEGTAWALDVEQRAHLYFSDKKFHRREQMNFYQMQRLGEIYTQRDNDWFWRATFDRSKRLQNPQQVDIIDPTQVPYNGYTDTDGNYCDNDGIVRDERGREVAYKVKITREDGTRDIVEVPAFVGGRQHMGHVFTPDYAGQGRGISRLAYALQEFQQITDFTISQIMKAINQSSLSIFVEPSNTNPASDPTEALQSGRYAGVPSSVYGSGAQVTVDGTSLSADQIVQFCPIPEATVTQPGSVNLFSLQKGETIKPGPSNAPSDSYDNFINSFVTHLSAGNSMPMEVLLMKMSSSYSASRGALILFWMIVEIWRNELAIDFLNPILKNWLSGEIAAGRISARGWSDPIMQAAWLNHGWIGAPMPNIDPAKTAKADKTYAELGAHTLDRIAREKNGSSGAANRKRLAMEYKELETPPWTVKAGA